MGPRQSRGLSTSSVAFTEVPLSSIRNISAWGHIDAGKTTLTERLLYHTGGMASSPERTGASAGAALPGDVDSGSTVTDFLQQERERGITIQSAAVGPLWWTSGVDAGSGDQGSTAAITLVDTPGHIDFTIEVERALRVADGCIVVMDSVEGVEAQTEGNWRIGKRYGISSNILFINKLDRVGASVANSIRSFVQRGLHPRPVLLQLPILPSDSSGAEIDGGILGVVDLLQQQELRFSGRAGETIERSSISDPKLREQAKEARHALVETLASLDEPLLEELFSIESPDAGTEPHEHLPTASIKASLRRLTISGQVVPALIGSAAKHIGVQPLLDAVADYLPSPSEAGDVRDQDGKGIGTVYGTTESSPALGGGSSSRGGQAAKQKSTAPSAATTSKQGTASVAAEGPDPSSSSAPLSLNTGNSVAVNVEDPALTALAFKVVWDKRRGPMTFVRVYSGCLTRNTTLYNTATKSRERLSRLLLPFGATYTEVEKLAGGQVGVLLGLKDTRTGDTLIDARGKTDTTLRLRRVDVPPPVFSVSVEPHSKSDEESVNEALANLIRTDPSLRIDSGNPNVDSAGGGGSAFGAAGTNQTVLSGMGELHLEIAKDRLQNEFGAKARIGSVRVAFRETVDAEEAVVVDEVLEKDMAGKRVKFGCKVVVRSLGQDETGDAATGDNAVEISLDGDGQLGLNASKSQAKTAKRHAEATRGPSPSNRSGALSSEGHSGEASSPDATDAESLRRSILAGVTASLSRGPLSSHPLTRVSVQIADVQTFGPEQSPLKAISAITQALVRKAIREAGVRIMEPVMDVRIQTEEAYLGKVVADVTTEQQGDIVEVEHEGAATEGGVSGEAGAGRDISVYLPKETWSEETTAGGQAGPPPGPAPRQKTTILALIPLSKLVSYSSRLRALTAGTSTYTMQLHGFKSVSDERQKQILSDLGRV
ncbi:unnamed protein product [Parajaminaea phylloscopi]